jgi:stringent starvation protein B
MVRRMGTTGDGDDGNDTGNLVRVDFARRAAKTKREIPRVGLTTATTSEAEATEGELLLLEMFAKWIEMGMVQVTIDARRDDVRVPQSLKSANDLRLNFSQRFHIADFVWDRRGVRASLSFSGQPYFCDVPWRAVWMLYSHVTNETLLAPREHVPSERRDVFDFVVESIEDMAPKGDAVVANALEAPGGGDFDDDGDAPGASASSPDEGKTNSAPTTDDDEPRPPPPAGGGKGLRLVKR